ncbi:MAG: hypothetical protein JNJ88_01745 [Planctomycetes bacterium]|nr:hypothetical protein [Planctomycetota bacterium]
MRGRSQFIGLAGQYHVAYSLSVRGFHAAITMGNVPDVDILVASVNGSRLLSIQVKTSRNALRPKRYGAEAREWDVSAHAPGQKQESLWYAFVDLQENEVTESCTPLVFLVPSLWVGTQVKASWSRKMFLLHKNLWPQCEEQWDRVGSFLNGDQDVLDWMKSVPVDLEWWGAPDPR